ncbi:hypothetical protein FHS39_002602 [Streptomyces olivoverticillatus]|uniref:Uncharacterized protein n=1 Tax=Streptomyces olivoverticillatus TaxID=66427 RepID=A0A7W7PJW2_9ACTN|nr:hypothetical protein [Streptomyces olivoverticillatus]MBB4893571.1 hypothetical protein [Streptomyces olivoverticillatus]
MPAHSHDPVPAHNQTVTNRYIKRYPEHPHREDDPHYALFEAYRRRTRPTARCAMAVRYGTAAHCSGGLELHHAAVEFAVANEVDMKLVMRDFPEVTDHESFERWLEAGDSQLMWLCAHHHRGSAGVHVVSAADWAAAQYAPDFLQ